MDYRTIEKEIRNQKGGVCFLDDWVIECKEHIYTKIIAFNLFVDIHLGNINEGHLLKNIFEVEKHLATKKSYDPLDRIKGLYFSVDSLNSIETTVQKECKLSRIVEISTIQTIFGQYTMGHNIDKAGGGKDESAIKNLLDEMSSYLSRNENGTPFKIPKAPNDINLVWVTKFDEIETYRNEGSCFATTLRDLLGLFHFGEKKFYLIKFIFSSESIPHRPVIFHSGFVHYWSPAFEKSGWGKTLNLKSFSEGASEAVIINGNWPKITYEQLGHCDDLDIPIGKWEEYLEKRINDFKLWGEGDSTKEEDIEYFLSKWN